MKGQRGRDHRSNSDAFIGGGGRPPPSPPINPNPGADEQERQVLLVNQIAITHLDYFRSPRRADGEGEGEGEGSGENKDVPVLRPGDKPTVAHFEWGEELGEGSFGLVRRARLKCTGQEFAIKVLDKKHVIKMDKVKYVASERDILFQLDHPNIIKLHYTFQDQACLYFVMELAPGGELFEQIQKHGPTNLQCAQFYVAEIVCALEYLHAQGIVHRDIKPENMLVAADGHIKISDFGSAAKQSQLTDAKATFVGTAEYVSPELLNNKGATQSSDIWALGCVVFQMLAGYPPFRGETDYLIFQKILHREFEFPDSFPALARDLVDKLLMLAPEDRLGSGGNYDAIKSHPFFHGIDFNTLIHQVPPPFTTSRNRSSASSITMPSEYCAFNSFRRGPLDVVELQALVEQQSQLLPQWSPLMLPNEAIIITAVMHKRVGLFARPRQFILTAFPRLVYFHIEKKEQKGEIPWSAITRLEMRDSTTLYIHTHTRTYFLESVSNPQRWIDAIEFLRLSCEMA